MGWMLELFDFGRGKTFLSTVFIPAVGST